MMSVWNGDLDPRLANFSYRRPDKYFFFAGHRGSLLQLHTQLVTVEAAIDSKDLGKAVIQ